MTVGERIKRRREELGLSQSELAIKMGYSGKTSVSKAETYGDNITTDKIKKFADALQTTPSHLMGWDESADEYLIFTDETLQLDVEFKQLTADNQKNVLQYIRYLKSTQNN